MNLVHAYALSKLLMPVAIALKGKFADKHYAIEVFNQHIESVKQNVPFSRLLVYQITEGWDSLCRFLDAPVPNQTFPRLNERATFKQGLGQLLSEQR